MKGVVRWMFVGCAFFAAGAGSSSAKADGKGGPVVETSSADASSYCRKVRARGGADAALLMWPQVVLQGIRFPASNVDLTLVGKTQYQGRVGLSLSPTDFFRGIAAKDVAAADCQQHDVQAVVEQLLAHADDAGKLAALRKQSAYFDSHQGQWRALLDKEGERFVARTVSLGARGHPYARAPAGTKRRGSARRARSLAGAR